MKAGETTAFVGPSGSGKSTIIQLVMRFYNPMNDGGEILLDGKPIKNYDLRSIRKNVGYVGQEPVLFNCSIRKNMLLAKPNATEHEINKALKLANCNFVERMEKGIETSVGAQGGKLSGG
jgi:ABC-type multidrug transport system fused ATPase/permease subunit